MKNLLLSSLCLLLCLALSFPVHAQAQNKYIGTGHTADGVPYTIYEVETTTSMMRTKGQQLNIIRQIRFAGIIKPPATKVYTETLNGSTYTGILKLYSFTYENNYTIAAYKGTLTAIN